MAKKVKPKLKPGTIEWHNQQVLECIDIAKKLTDKANEWPKPEAYAMQAVQMSVQALLHAFLSFDMRYGENRTTSPTKEN